MKIFDLKLNQKTMFKQSIKDGSTPYKVKNSNLKLSKKWQELDDSTELSDFSADDDSELGKVDHHEKDRESSDEGDIYAQYLVTSAVAKKYMVSTKPVTVSTKPVTVSTKPVTDKKKPKIKKKQEVISTTKQLSEIELEKEKKRVRRGERRECRKHYRTRKTKRKDNSFLESIFNF